MDDLNWWNMTKNVGVTIEILVWHFFLQSPPIFFHSKVGYYPPNKKLLDKFAITCDFEDQKAILKKMHFLARKWRFFKKWFFQNWSGIKTTSYAHAKKYIFKIKFIDCNFHQILPIHRHRQYLQNALNYNCAWIHC